MTDLVKAADALVEVVVNQNWEALDAALSAYRQARESVDRVKVKPLDLSTLLKHAFLSGIVAARNTPAHEEISGPDLWLDYDPTGNAAYTRIKAVLEN